MAPSLPKKPNDGWLMAMLALAVLIVIVSLTNWFNGLFGVARLPGEGWHLR